MSVSAEISRLVNEMRNDRSHSAIELARQALVVLKTAAERSQAGNVERFLHEQRGLSGCWRCPARQWRRYATLPAA